jgi:hypothetical protein
MLRGHSSLMAHKGQIPLLKIRQGERLDGWSWQQPFVDFFLRSTRRFSASVLFDDLEDSNR